MSIKDLKKKKNRSTIIDKIKLNRYGKEITSILIKKHKRFKNISTLWQENVSEEKAINYNINFTSIQKMSGIFMLI